MTSVVSTHKTLGGVIQVIDNTKSFGRTRIETFGAEESAFILAPVARISH